MTFTLCHSKAGHFHAVLPPALEPLLDLFCIFRGPVLTTEKTSTVSPLKELWTRTKVWRTLKKRKKKQDVVSCKAGGWAQELTAVARAVLGKPVAVPSLPTPLGCQLRS